MYKNTRGYDCSKPVSCCDVFSGVKKINRSFSMGKLTISMTIFHSYVKLPEGKWQRFSDRNIPQRRSRTAPSARLFRRERPKDVEDPQGCYWCEFSRTSRSKYYGEIRGAIQ